MRTRDKQNKHKLKFLYISNLKKLGKIWKEHCSRLDPSMAKADSNYNYEVVKLMNEDSKQEYCFILDKCDDIVANMRKVDESKDVSFKFFYIEK